MRILITVERYHPHVGGAERVAQRIAEGLFARGHEVTVVTSGSRHGELINGVSVERFPVSGNFAVGITGDPSDALALIRSRDPDVIFNYAAQTWTTDVCSRLLYEPRRPPLVLAPCGFSALHHRAYRGYFQAVREWLPRYDRLVFHSARYRDWAFAGAAGATRRDVIANGADPPLERGPAPAPGRAAAPLALTVSSHVRSKGHRDFVRAVRRLHRSHGARGLIVAPRRQGASSLRGCAPYCTAASRALSRYLSIADGSDPRVVPGAMASADVFLLPSRVECAPLVVLEAMAAGVPWVSYDVGNVSELDGGLVVGGLHEMVASTRAVLDGDHPLLGQAGRRSWAANHRWQSIVDEYEQLFQRSAAGRDRALTS